MKNLFYLLLFISSLCVACEDDMLDDNNVITKVELEVLARQTTAPEIIVTHTNYTTSFNTSTYCPNWVSWHLTKDRIQGTVSRSDSFKPDTLLPKAYQIVTTDYSNSGYDRGHMCPAADNKNSEQCMKESFFMSNMCPQTHNLNAGDWSELEDLCRQWVVDYSDLYIVCGPIYDTKKPKTIGKAGRPQIAVPDRFYKVVLMNGRIPKMMGFILPNDVTNKDIREYCVSVDEVERITGIDFYPSINDEMENMLEMECNPGAWGI